MAADRVTTNYGETQRTPVESRQGVTGHGASIVLLVSLTLCVLAGLTLLSAYTWNAYP